MNSNKLKILILLNVVSSTEINIGIKNDISILPFSLHNENFKKFSRELYQETRFKATPFVDIPAIFLDVARMKLCEFRTLKF